MHLQLTTAVTAPLPTVWQGFDRDLFKKLSPPFPPVRVLRFDGCMKDDQVILELNFLLFRQQWQSLITDQAETEAEIYFIDEGIQLPFFLKAWKHTHRLRALPGGGTCVEDDIHFSSPHPILDYLLYPLLWVQFAYRKPIYRRVFS